jgi:NAD(P)H-hydrate epimerase
MNQEQSYLALLTPEQMQRIERKHIDAGTPSFDLMMQAGESVAAFIRSTFAPAPILVLTGPGNNGGDGYVIAESLRVAGWEVTLASFTHTAPRTPDAILAHNFYHGDVVEYSADLLANMPMIVDAIFGTGLTKSLDAKIVQAISDIESRNLPVIAVDIPSGVHGETGAVLGAAFKAAATMTFTRKKIGHTVLPGKEYCGTVLVADIGIPDTLVIEENPGVFQNEPELWIKHLRQPDSGTHKYMRGHVGVLGGIRTMTGASRLSALAAQRSGAGLVSVVCNEDTLPVLAPALTSIMTVLANTEEEYAAWLKDERITSLVIGPGAGVNDRTRAFVKASLDSGKATVIDADAISAFAGNAESLKTMLHPQCILTPHEGEFERLFKNTPVSEKSTKLEKTLEAARWIGATVAYKGSDTIIASPEGIAVVNVNAPPTLATAGSGDVLAGICGGLLAQGIPAFDAACAAVWMHGEAALMFGVGLIADDLNDTLPDVLRFLQE